jgi:hypothetical protein
MRVLHNHSLRGFITHLRVKASPRGDEETGTLYFLRSAWSIAACGEVSKEPDRHAPRYGAWYLIYRYVALDSSLWRSLAIQS